MLHKSGVEFGIEFAGRIGGRVEQLLGSRARNGLHGKKTEGKEQGKDTHSKLDLKLADCIDQVNRAKLGRKQMHTVLV